MNNKVWLNLMLLIIMAIIFSVLNGLQLFSRFPIILALYLMISSFGFGLALNNGRRRSKGWVWKLVIAFSLAIVFLFNIQLIHIPWLSGFQNSLYIYLFYIFCGWAFFQD